ncbi:M50 family metallopeptidase [Paenibacillus tarimensis]
MIKWSGIRWSVHPLFLLVMLASIVTGYFLELITLFAIVIVHELGHVFAAKSYGWTIREVKLLPFGGVAEVEEAGHVPAAQEIAVVIAGPLQNGWMGLLAWTMGHAGLISPEWSAHLVQANIMIGLFNLLPILPLDGGRLLQAVLSYQLPYHLTLLWGARISLIFSFAMIVYAAFPGIWAGGVQMNVLAIGAFLFASNWTYHRNVPYLFVRFLMRREQASGDRRKRGVIAQPIVVAGTKTIQAVLKLLMREKYHLIYVMELQEIVAVLPEERLIDGYLVQGIPGSAVRELLR